MQNRGVGETLSGREEGWKHEGVGGGKRVIAE
jgi:hypothetical protein